MKYVIAVLITIVIGTTTLGALHILTPEQVTASYGMVLSGFFGYLAKSPKDE